MLALALTVASLASGWSASLPCRDGGADIATAATEALAGPGGAVAVLRVSSADDHLKTTHLCNADYELSFTRTPGETPVTIKFLSTNAAWGRKLSHQLDGFSEDGTRIFGVLRESGHDRFTVLFEYDTKGGKVRLLLLPQAFGAQPGCEGAVSVAGTAGPYVVLASECGTATRWLVAPSPGGLPRHLWGPDMTWNGDDLATGRVRRLQAHEPVVPLRERSAPRAPVDRVAPPD